MVLVARVEEDCSGLGVVEGFSGFGDVVSSGGEVVVVVVVLGGLGDGDDFGLSCGVVLGVVVDFSGLGDGVSSGGGFEVVVVVVVVVVLGGLEDVDGLGLSCGVGLSVVEDSEVWGGLGLSLDAEVVDEEVGSGFGVFSGVLLGVATVVLDVFGGLVLSVVESSVGVACLGSECVSNILLMRNLRSR